MPPRSSAKKNAIDNVNGTPDPATPYPQQPQQETPEELVTRMRKETLQWALRTALVKPFTNDQVKFLPRNVKNDRCLAMPYIDARLVQDRLDEVMGVDGWKDDYFLVADGSVVCKLSLKIEGEWVTKTDVGSTSEQPDAGDRMKAAFSDALKRAAVKFGIGRYLYRCPPQWCDYDPVKKQIKNRPNLPAFALPPKPEPNAPVYHDDEYDEPGVATAAGTPQKDKPNEQPKEQPKAKEAPAPVATAATGGKKTDKEIIDEQLAEWNKRLVGCDTPDDLNALKPLIKNIPAPARGPVWQYILDSVCADPVNWKFDEATKKFVELDATVGDGIPF